MPRSPRFCIYGAGAVGGTIGAMLARSGARVSVVARGKALAAIRRHGLTVISAGEVLQATVRVSDDPADLGPQDFVIVAVKSPALPEVAERIGPLLGPDTAVVTAMNGVPWWFFASDNGSLVSRRLTSIDPDGAIGRAIPSSRVIGCAVYLSSSLEAPGVVRHHVHRRLTLGEADGESTLRLSELTCWLRRAGFECTESADIRSDVWLKLWGNLSTNPISMLTMATLDRILDDPLLHALCARMMDEAARIGRVLGIQPTLSVDEMLLRARSFGPVKTSMLQDAERGTPVELDSLLTVVHDLGRIVHVPTPFIDSVLGLARLRASGLGLMAPRAFALPPTAANDALALRPHG
jgi:2-dehydropantoate 2-reductase